MTEASSERHPASLRRLVRRVNSVVDPTLHLAIVKELLESEPAGEVVEVLRTLMTEVDRDGYRPAYQAVVQVVIIRQELGYHRLGSLYRAAAAAAYPPVRMLLLRAPAALVAGDDEVLPDPQLLEVPLGRRKSMARTTDRDLRMRIARDPDPSVVAILLENPRLTEPDVVRVVARRPNLAAIIELVASHPRWHHRYNVLHSVSQNPYTPASLAASMVPFLNRRDLRELAQDAALHVAVQEAAATLVGWRSERRGLTGPGRVLH